MKEVNAKAHPAYVSPEELDADIRDAIMATAGILGALYDFPKPMRDQFLGVDISEEDWTPGFYTDWPDERLWKSMPLERHPLTDVLRTARAYAFQEGGWPDDGSLETIHDEIVPIIEQLPQRDINGIETVANRSSPDPIGSAPPRNETWKKAGRLRRVADMFTARRSLDQGCWLSIADLALLSGLGEQTVRTTISREGLRAVTREMEARSDDDLRAAEINGLDSGDAHDFLSRRRHFIPSRAPTRESMGDAARRIVLEGFGPFPERLERLLAVRGMTPATLTELAGTPLDWTDSLVKGASVEPRLDDIVRLSRALDCAAGRFAALAIEHLLSD